MEKGGGEVTPEERAEKIVHDNFLIHLDLTGGVRQESIREAQFRKLKELIAAEIRAAVEERKGNSLAANPHEWFCLDCRPIAEELGRQAVLNAKAEAYEDAAKIAERHEWKDHGDDDCLKIAPAIRARAAEVPSKGSYDGAAPIEPGTWVIEQDEDIPHYKVRPKDETE